MSKYERVRGGEKNLKSGLRWTKDELQKVCQLYISDRNLKIHEHNKEIQELAANLNRTVRSVEAQLLMFRSLDRFGFYGYRNMNKICRELWQEYINSTLPQ